VELTDAPVEVFRCSVARSSASTVIRLLSEAVELATPGHGALFAQDVAEVSRVAPTDLGADVHKMSGLLKDLILITGIQSMSGSGQKLARIALELGAGVPVVSLGTGTGIRDRMGLIRITISPEKELLHLMVPSHDADGLQRLLIEEGHLDRPGGGFLYQTPIRLGIVDPLLRIGRQEHAASIEQIIAAVDDLKSGTTWRKRFAGVDSKAMAAAQSRVPHSEITFVCAEGRADALVQAAMRAGADGATLSRVRCLGLAEDMRGRNAARDRGIICVPSSLEGGVFAALQCAAEVPEDPFWQVQILQAPVVFSYQRR
jgi:hypothetical protein